MTDINDTPDASQAKQRVTGIFSRAASTYDRVGPRFFSHYGCRLVELARIPPGAVVLDVATGRGAVLFPASAAVGPQGSVTGIDLSENMAQETARELAGNGLPNMKVCQMDAENLQFPDGSFDYVLCGFGIFFFHNLYRALSESHRVLRPTGRIAVSTWGKPDTDEWEWLQKLIETYLPPPPETENQQAAGPGQPPAPPVFGTPEGMQAILKTAGFDAIQVIQETAEFVYTSEEEWWVTQWSHGRRGALERIERQHGPQGLERFRVEAFEALQARRQPDGFHERFYFPENHD